MPILPALIIQAINWSGGRKSILRLDAESTFLHSLRPKRTSEPRSCTPVYDLTGTLERIRKRRPEDRRFPHFYGCKSGRPSAPHVAETDEAEAEDGYGAGLGDFIFEIVKADGITANTTCKDVSNVACRRRNRHCLELTER